MGKYKNKPATEIEQELKEQIEICKLRIETIEKFCEEKDYTFADIIRGELRDDLEELECLLEAVR